MLQMISLLIHLLLGECNVIVGHFIIGQKKKKTRKKEISKLGVFCFQKWTWTFLLWILVLSEDIGLDKRIKITQLLCISYVVAACQLYKSLLIGGKYSPRPPVDA